MEFQSKASQVNILEPIQKTGDMHSWQIKPVGRFSFNISELWKYRELIYFFSWRDIKIKYKQTILGALWAVLQPLLLMLIFTFFFSKAINIHSDIPYPVFVFSGLLLWNFFSAGISTAGQSMVNNAYIIKKIYFPRLIIPIASIVSVFVDFLFSLMIYFVILIYYHFGYLIGNLVLVLPLSILICVMTALGAGSMLSALNVKYRDFKYIIPFMVQVLMFVSPVIYPVSFIHLEWLRQLLELNPIAGAIELLRSIISQTPIDWNLTLKGFVMSLLLLVSGIFFFRKTEYYFADLA